MLAEVALQRDAGEHLRDELGVGAAHDAVAGRDDEAVETGRLPVERPLDGLSAVPCVDVAPEIPLALLRVVVEAGEGVVVGRLHDVREAQRHDLERGIPAHELDRHLLLEVLDQGVGRLGSGGVVLVHGDVRRRHVERQPEHGLARRVDDVPDAGPPRGLEDVVGRADVVVEGRDIAEDAGRRDGREVHDRVEPVVLVVDAEDRVERLAVVGQIDPHEPGAALPRRVEVDDVVAARPQLADDGASELA